MSFTISICRTNSFRIKLLIMDVAFEAFHDFDEDKFSVKLKSHVALFHFIG